MTATVTLATAGFSSDGRAASAALRCAADVLLVVGSDGLIREGHVAPELEGVVRVTPGAAAVGIVAPEDRQAFAAVLGAAAAGRIPEPLEVRHSGQAAAAQIRYAALPADPSGDVLLIGRLLQRTEGLAARVSEARRAAGRDEVARRAVEARYQMLFEGGAEAILVVALGEGIVDEANPRALALLGLAESEVVGRSVEALVAEADRARLAGLVAAEAERGEAPPVVLSLAPTGRRVRLHARAFRAFDRRQVMLRLEEIGAADALTPAEALVAGLMRGAGQSVALADATGRIIWVSDAFPVPAGDRAGALAGRSIGELLEGAGIAARTVLATAREHGRITCRGVQLRTGAGAIGGDLTVVALVDQAPAGFGLLFHPDGEDAAEASAGRATAGAATRTATEAQEIAAAIGQAPMKDLVRDVADAIERSCIEAALRLTDGNKAAAAEALGLSRQSLYLKLHRFGLL